MRPLPHGYTNDTRGDGTVVVKRFTGPDAPARWATERDTLERLAGRLPVPALLAALAKCRAMLALRRTLGPADPGYARWRRAIVTTDGWADIAA